MEPVIYVDIRSLQDPMYQFRGVGYHVSSLLRTFRNTGCSDWKLVGLITDELPTLPAQYSQLIDEVTYCKNPPISRSGTGFIDPSPMTHDPRFTLRFAAEPRFFNCAIIYDFIPFDWPGYLSTAASRIDYLSKVVRLRNFDLYFPISEYSAWRLAEIAGIPREKITVTGACVRSALYEIRKCPARRSSPYGVDQPYFLCVGGGDRRKNVETAVAAVAKLNCVGSPWIQLKVVGHYGAEYKSDLLRIAGHNEGRCFLEFCCGVDDETLAVLYAGAVATIVPSHIEGFSLPIAESAVCGTPVVASSCGAHLELIHQKEALFSSRDQERLTDILRTLANNPSYREQLLQAQADIAERFHENRVGERFWNRITEAVPERQRVASMTGSHRPRIAVLTPYPPDRSGVARYTQLTLEAARRHIDIEIYTNAPRPLDLPTGLRDAGRISVTALYRNGYNSVISVVGNSHFHTSILEIMEHYGGPCILHDSRLTQIYFERLGPERFLKFASDLLGRSVAMPEVHTWLQDREVPSLFIEPILRRARPLIVHTRQYQSILLERYGVQAELSTFCPNIHFEETELKSESRLTARKRLGASADVFLIATFGYVARVKGFDTCIIATEMLRNWKIPAELYFVGSTAGLESEMRRLADVYGITPYVHWYEQFVDDQKYRDFMLAADAAIQLRTYGFGQPSAALADAISAGMAAVATQDLACACDAPEYVLTVPNRYSPLQIAEQLATIWEAHRSRQPHIEARRHYLEVHNFDYYTTRLREILELT